MSSPIHSDLLQKPYIASFPKRREPLTAEQRDLLHRRTQPFLKNGMHYSIEHLLKEAYLQGLRDAVNVMERAA